jgi:transcriptional regulator with XRE-family HTH domain
MVLQSTTRHTVVPYRDRRSHVNKPKAPGLAERVRGNIRALKGLRSLSDQEIADRAGYATRQAFNHRVSGRTVPDLDDIERIAAALGVTPDALLAPLDQLTAWMAENPTYKPPKITKIR